MPLIVCGRKTKRRCAVTSSSPATTSKPISVTGAIISSPVTVTKHITISVTQ